MHVTKKILWIGFKTLLEKEIIRILRIWPQTLVPQIITTILYFIIFGQLLGVRIKDIDGVNFMDYIIPGLIASNILSTSYLNSVLSFFTAKFQRNIEEMLLSPMSSHTIILGYIISSMFRGLFTAVIITLIASFFTKLNFFNIPLAIFVATISSFLFATIGLINGIFAKTFDDTAFATTFLITPLTYLGGVFYSINMLSPLFQKLLLLNPIFYIISSFRYTFIGTSDINIYYTLTILLVITTIAYAIANYLFRKQRL